MPLVHLEVFAKQDLEDVISAIREDSQHIRANIEKHRSYDAATITEEGAFAGVSTTYAFETRNGDVLTIEILRTMGSLHNS